MEIEQSKDGDTVVVVPHGSLDIDGRQVFQDVLVGLVDTGETKVLVNLSAVDYVTSTGLSALLYAAQRMEEIKGKFALCSLNDTVNRVFEVSGFTTIFDIYPNVDKALTRMK